MERTIEIDSINVKIAVKMFYWLSTIYLNVRFFMGAKSCLAPVILTVLPLEYENLTNFVVKC